MYFGSYVIIFSSTFSGGVLGVSFGGGILIIKSNIIALLAPNFPSNNLYISHSNHAASSIFLTSVAGILLFFNNSSIISLVSFCILSQFGNFPNSLNFSTNLLSVPGFFLANSRYIHA